MKRIVLTLACFMATIAYTNAQTVLWDGGAGTNNWMDAMNWDTDIIPLATEDVLIDLSGSTIDLSGATTVLMVEVKNSCTLNIASGASLTISGATADDGLETSGSGIIVNNGTITISTSATDNIDGIYTKGTFTNNGVIIVDDIGEHGLYVQGGSFTNAAGGTITVTNVGKGSSDGDGVYLDDNSGTPGVFTNNGTLNVTMTTGDDGVYIKDASIFDNTSMLTIDCSAGNDMGLHLVNASAEFSNSGVVTITDAPDYAIQIDGANVVPACFIDNAGTITVNGGANNGTSNDGLRMRRGGYITNSGTFTFNATGDESIQIDDSSVGSVGNNVSTFDNSGTVDIINSFDHGMELFGNFNNLAGGFFKADGCTDDGIRIQNSTAYNGLFTNDGNIRIDNSGSDDIETDDVGNFVNSATATFAPGSSPGDLKIREDFNLGASVVTFEINGTAATAEYDQILNKNSVNTLTISGATAHLEWGYLPAVDDCFKIVDESGQVAGPWGTVTSSNPLIEYTVDYFGSPAEVRICVTAILDPPPANNDCSGAAILATNGPETLTGQSFVGATSSGPAESCDGDTAPVSSSQNDLWFQVNTDNDGGDLIIAVDGGVDSDIVLALYDGCGGTQLDCEDGTGNDGVEIITFADPAFIGKGESSSTRSNVDYWVRVYEKAESGNVFSISASGTALPVELISFTGRKTAKGAQLNWETANEINNDGFEIERSKDATEWASIGYVRGVGNSSELLQYSYLDESPVNGLNYYRLKQSDLDGKSEYSNKVLVDFNKKRSDFSLYPNPVNDVLFVEMDRELENIEIKLYDSNGKTLWINKGAVNQIPFEGYKQGIYFLEIISPLSRTIQKIIK